MTVYEMWQYCEQVVAVRLFERLCWQDRYGRVHVESQEPIHLVQGCLPDTEAGKLAVVEGIKQRTVQAYVCHGEVLDAQWEVVAVMEVGLLDE